MQRHSPSGWRPCEALAIATNSRRRSGRNSILAPKCTRICAPRPLVRERCCSPLAPDGGTFPTMAARRKAKAKAKSRTLTKTPLPRQYLSQSDVPRHSLEEALRVPRSLFEQFGMRATRPISLAQALELQPNSSHFRTLLGAAIAYGLTTGGPNAPTVEVTQLGKRIVAPTAEGDDVIAKREAVVQPRVVREFVDLYEGKPLPREDIAKNVLVEVGVPREAATRSHEIILDNLRTVDGLRVIKGTTYIDLQHAAVPRQDGRDAGASTIATQPTPTPVAQPRGKTRPKAQLESAGDDAAPQPEREVPNLAGRGADASRSGFVAAPIPEHDGPLRRGLQVDCYVLEDRLGQGFSAEVWSASVQRSPQGVDLASGAKVAIKFYHGHAMAMPDQVIRIEREFRIAQGVRHPYLLRIYEFLLSSSRPHHNFLVMDLARGSSLKDQIPPMGMSLQKAVQIGHQLFAAVQALHEAGALHRDIKPGNISLEDTPGGMHLTLLDLGIVTVLHERNLTAASRFLGSKHWAP